MNSPAYNSQHAASSIPNVLLLRSFRIRERHLISTWTGHVPCLLWCIAQFNASSWALILKVEFPTGLHEVAIKTSQRCLHA